MATGKTSIAKEYIEPKTLRQMCPLGAASRRLAAFLAQLERMEERCAEAKRFLKDWPFSGCNLVSNEPWLHEKDRQHLLQGYIKAGLPK